MALSTEAYVLAKKYTKDTALGMGAVQGKDGADGKSAYEVAKDNGFEGTEQEWLDSLKMDSSDVEELVQEKIDEKLEDAVEQVVQEKMEVASNSDIDALW